MLAHSMQNSMECGDDTLQASLLIFSCSLSSNETHDNIFVCIYIQKNNNRRLGGNLNGSCVRDPVAGALELD